MSDSAARLQGKLKMAAWLLIAGLAVEAMTIQWAHPMSFVLFIIVGGALILAGVATYLIAIVTG